MAGSQYDGEEPEQRDGAREMIAGASRERDHGHAAAGEKTMTGKLVQLSSGLSQPFIQRPVMTMMLTVSTIFFGLITYKQLAVNDLPAVDDPALQVSGA